MKHFRGCDQVVVVSWSRNSESKSKLCEPTRLKDELFDAVERGGQIFKAGYDNSEPKDNCAYAGCA